MSVFQNDSKTLQGCQFPDHNYFGPMSQTLELPNTACTPSNQRRSTNDKHATDKTEGAEARIAIV